MELLGNWTELIEGKKGEIYVVEMITRLPVIEGNYNVTLVASKAIIENRTALFLSLVENAAVFAVEENQKGKLWDKVFLKNEISIRKIC